MVEKLLQTDGNSAARHLEKTPGEEGTIADATSRLGWAEEQRLAWMEIAKESDRWVDQLEEACGRLHEQVLRQRHQLDQQEQKQAEQQKRIEGLQRCLEGRTAELEVILQAERQRAACLQEMVAYYSQFRFRATDRAARLLGRMPFLYRPLRLTARGLTHVLRTVKGLVRPARS
jgi:hypothetical protein